jgi:hypothetical protein
MHTDDVDLVQEMIRDGRVVLCPPGVDDDRWIIGYARSNDGFLVSNDMYRDHIARSETSSTQLLGEGLAEWLSSHRIPFAFIPARSHLVASGHAGHLPHVTDEFCPDHDLASAAHSARVPLVTVPPPATAEVEPAASSSSSFEAPPHQHPSRAVLPSLSVTVEHASSSASAVALGERVTGHAKPPDAESARVAEAVSKFAVFGSALVTELVEGLSWTPSERMLASARGSVERSEGVLEERGRRFLLVASCLVLDYALTILREELEAKRIVSPFAESPEWSQEVCSDAAKTVLTQRPSFVRDLPSLIARGDLREHTIEAVLWHPAVDRKGRLKGEVLAAATRATRKRLASSQVDDEAVAF